MAKRNRARRIWHFESPHDLCALNDGEIVESILSACGSATLTMDDTIDICRACAEELKRRASAHA